MIIGSLVVVLAAASVCWMVLVAMPFAFGALASDRLRENRADLLRLVEERPALVKHAEVLALDDFLYSLVAEERHFGLSNGLAVLTRVWRERHAPPDSTTVFDDLDPLEQGALHRIAARALRLSFCRAAMGSCVWFIAWPLAVWATHAYASQREFVSSDDQMTELLSPIENAREVFVADSVLLRRLLSQPDHAA